MSKNASFSLASISCLKKNKFENEYEIIFRFEYKSSTSVKKTNVLFYIFSKWRQFKIFNRKQSILQNKL